MAASSRCCCGAAMCWRGTALPLLLLFHPRLGGPRATQAAALLVVLGAFAWLYVFIIGGQAFPLEIFPGYAASSSFGDGAIAHYAPRWPEWLLGLGGVGAAFVLTDDRRARARLHAAGRLRGLQGPTRRRRHERSARLLVSAAHKSSGKTTVSVGLCAALRAQGLAVQPFKKGPDYIDPMWLAQAAGRDCFNLDPYLSSRDEITATFARHAAAADISLVEGNKGLYDGLALDGSNSNAALAQLLGLPVVLVHRRARHDARHRAADPRLPGLRPRHPHRRRDPQPARRQPARGQAARRDRALHRRAGARRGGARPAAAAWTSATWADAQRRARRRGAARAATRPPRSPRRSIWSA